MEDSVYIVAGGIILLLSFFIWYSIVHFVVISFNTPYKNRTPYQKFITIFAIVGLFIIFIGLGQQ